MVSFGPPKPPRHSRKLPRHLEEELIVGVFDAGDDPYIGAPQLIIGNAVSCCHGVCHIRPDGTEFMFHHAKGHRNTVCGCIVKREPDDETLQLPAELDLHRLRLMFDGPYRMEAKYAAMVVMKLFLGMKVPEELQIKAQETNPDPEEQSDSQDPESST